MQVDPRMEQFGEIMESTPESEELFAKLAAEGKIIARAPQEELKLLQDSLRKAGYRHVK